MKQKEVASLVSNLPESPNIMAKDTYFNAAVLVPLVCIDGEMHLLFQKRAVDIRQGSEICFPGGVFDRSADKRFKDTAVRETIEELGIEKKQIRIIGRLDTLVSVSGITVDPFLGVLENNIMNCLCINPREVEKVFTLPVSFFQACKPETYHVRLTAQSSYTDSSGKKSTLLPSKKLGLPEIYHREWGGSLHRVLVYKTAHGVLWGITAEIVHDMINKLT